MSKIFEVKYLAQKEFKAPKHIDQDLKYLKMKK